VTWEFFPAFTRMTVLKYHAPYLWGYEGTPGGKLEPNKDFWVRSDQTKNFLSQTWNGELNGPEWAYFGDGNSNRILFLIHHEEDQFYDQYWTMNGEMTVFGFGRKYQCCNPAINIFPGHFTIGFAEVADFDEAEEVINGAYRPIKVTHGKGEGLSTVQNSIRRNSENIRLLDFEIRQDFFGHRNLIKITRVPSGQSPKRLRLWAYTSSGKLVHTKKVSLLNKRFLVWNSEALSAGMYFIALGVAGNRTVKKVWVIK